MEANELRIGNLVLFEDELREIEGVTNIVVKQADEKIVLSHINLKYVFKKKIVVKLRDINPIPLTEEWLKKFGFIQHQRYYTIETGFYFDLHGNKKRTKLRIKHIPHSTIDNFHVVSPANGSIYLEYVNQLQNLYFVLKGEELTIKEK